MKVLLIEPYYGGSHKAWADGFCSRSRHEIATLTLPAQFWKWRMQGGAVTLARMFEEGGFQPDVILASDMFDLSLFRTLTRKQTHNRPAALYFHENQLTYPQNSRQKHGWRYGFVNYASALSADAIVFNSTYHYDVFFDALPRMLKHFGDNNELQTVDLLRKRAQVLPPGIDLQRFDAYEPAKALDDGLAPLILWNHRWDEDKNPQIFFDALTRLIEADIDFRVALVGENIRQKPDDFVMMRDLLAERVIHYGYLPDFADYARLLWHADYVVSTADQEFFGIAVIEAMYCECIPILPNRLNYPYLVPERMHSACLYPDNKLFKLLRYHLEGRIQPDCSVIKNSIAHYDWTMLIEHYDRFLQALAG